MKLRVELMMFDLDGTLADTGQDIANAVNHTRRQLDLGPLDNPAIYARVGRGIDYLIRAVLPNGLHGRFPEACRLFLEHYESHLLDNTRLYPHVEETLEYFRAKKKAVITNKLHGFTLSILEGLGIADRFELILGGDSTAKKSPTPSPSVRHWRSSPSNRLTRSSSATTQGTSWLEKRPASAPAA